MQEQNKNKLKRFVGLIAAAWDRLGSIIHETDYSNLYHEDLFEGFTV